MYRIIDGRATGKTSRLMLLAKENDGIVVCKDSKINSSSTPSCPGWIKNLRKKHASKINEDSVLTDNICFSSPSAASGFCVMGSDNGRNSWKSESGKTLKELEGEV